MMTFVEHTFRRNFSAGAEDRFWPASPLPSIAAIPDESDIAHQSAQTQFSTPLSLP